jgi:hypothetical protein
VRFRIFLTITLLAMAAVSSASDLPVIRSNSERISIRDGDDFRKNAWILAPEVNPDVYQVDLVDGKPHTVTMITDVDSISFLVELGGTYDFIIQWGEKACHTRLVGRRFVPAAVFDAAYRETHRGKTFIEVPEVYELVNVAIALTSLGLDGNNFVYHASPYYKRMRAHLVVTLDSLFQRSTGYYATIKMNGNAFEFDEHGRIVQSPVYDRTGFRSGRTNTLRPYLAQMQSFADESGFRAFYKHNEPFYAQQIAFFRDTVGVDEMKQWLEKNFPGVDPYDSYRIIFSPLVSYNQSSTWFESNGFRELQPHINFPYRRDVNRKGTLSPDGETLFRGNILFTELNHGYINVLGDQYTQEIRNAISHRERWVDKDRSAGYYRGIATFNEYMNWGLVSLRIVDYAPENEHAEMIEGVVGMMVKGRGFPRFREYNDFLVKLYRGREPQTTVADQYPQIIDWFAAHNQEDR